ncbi:MAG: insulinase family protein [Myxococcales bacterium]|nr:insulinase family protein [Myxococcales bacterium]
MSPAVKHERLDGPAGSSLLIEENHDLPLVRVQVALRVGAGDDPPELDGLTNFASELMGRGAGGRTRAQLDAAFDALGTSLDVMSDYDAVTFDFTVLKERLEPALTLMADVLLRPDFPGDESEKLKREIAAQLDEMRDDDGQLARRFFTRALYHTHPYGRTVIGTEQSLPALSLEGARRWHAESLRGGNIVFGVAGDVVAGAAADAILRHFAKLPAGGGEPGARPLVPRRSGMRITLVDKPERSQSQILLGQPAPRWQDPDFLALQVATTVFGGTFTARLMDEVRSKRGLSYGASARVGQGRGAKALVAHVFPSLDQTAETLELVLALWRDWVEEGVTEKEVAFARGYLAKSFAFSVATPEDRLELRTALELGGMPADFADTFAARVQKVERADAQRALKSNLTARDLEIVIVSTVDELRPKLEAAGLLKDATVEVVEYDSY